MKNIRHVCTVSRCHQWEHDEKRVLLLPNTVPQNKFYALRVPSFSIKIEICLQVYVSLRIRVQHPYSSSPFKRTSTQNQSGILMVCFKTDSWSSRITIRTWNLESTLIHLGIMIQGQQPDWIQMEKNRVQNHQSTTHVYSFKLYLTSEQILVYRHDRHESANMHKFSSLIWFSRHAYLSNSQNRYSSWDSNLRWSAP